MRSARLPVALALWTVVLVAGFWVVLTLGGRVASSDDELQVALHPPAPVSDAVARSSADTIVRIAYPDFHGVEPAIARANDFGVDRYVLVYRRPEVLSGVRVSIEVATGEVQVTTFP